MMDVGDADQGCDGNATAILPMHAPDSCMPFRVQKRDLVFFFCVTVIRDSGHYSAPCRNTPRQSDWAKCRNPGNPLSTWKHGLQGLLIGVTSCRSAGLHRLRVSTIECVQDTAHA